MSGGITFVPYRKGKGMSMVLADSPDNDINDGIQ